MRAHTVCTTNVVGILTRLKAGGGRGRTEGDGGVLALERLNQDVLVPTDVRLAHGRLTFAKIIYRGYGLILSVSVASEVKRRWCANLGLR